MLIDQIKADVTKAQKEQNAKLLGCLRLVVSELNYKAIDSGALTDELVVGVLRTEAKKRQESIDIYTKVGDTGRADHEKYELEVINTYLPAMMGEAQVEAEVDKIASVSPLRGGPLMGLVMGKLRGKADGGLVAKIVNSKYSS